MLDKRSKVALRYFVNECNEGSYQIFEIDEIMAHMPKKFKIDENVILQIVKYLENGEYISVKYADHHQFCLCPLPFGRQFIENIDQDEKTKKQIKNIALKNGFMYFLCSLIGAFLGTLIYYIV